MYHGRMLIDSTTQNFIGRYDHWHVHMQGLLQMVELNGGLEEIRPPTLAKIRK